MKRQQFILGGLALLGTLAFPAGAWADKLDDIRKAGVLRVAAFDGNPPFGYIDATSKKQVGHDIDLANEFARSLGVKIELVPTNPANRIPLLTSGKVDVVFASFTITDERAKVVDFTTPYFLVGQQFLARKGVLTDAAQLKDLRIGTEKGTTMETNLRTNYPDAKVVLYDDSPFALAALRNGNVQAITNDGVKLTAQWGQLPDKEKYEIPAITVSKEYLGAAVPKGETRLLESLNSWLTEIEKNGRAVAIYNAWFGPDSKAPLPRLLKIGEPRVASR
ncbi:MULTISPECIES: transporter substrate-binding domain-containing protein [unclassified Variovorax]|uniref:transporter substrate-binding domain-containing protein n=1 Tax=unclassified Variovorax TaxID=663243 RepID=UPI002578945C|nr:MULTISPECIES: transporter substrate-binding domain-containing protein [unclassified Variovorax]MDM0087529.1 transporter substrate-binding domain-containing protein [Variovorax sp. J22G40]MDM0144214.1 transporter substrate-binding domain-containing protein [Variovorax sp. J2P1-31]